MFEVANNKKVTLITNAEVQIIEGNIGNFRVKVVKKPRYVIEEKCNGCGACVDACPIFRPNEFDSGLSARKAVYIPFAQAVPKKALIDMKSCVKCQLCVLSCEEEAIDFNQKEEEIKLEVGTIIIATGYDVYTPNMGEYGYGKYPDVITQLTLERLLAPSGPTNGELVKISDGERPKRVVMIQCVGSRDIRTNSYCSEVCCMVALKNAKLIKQEYPDTEVTIWYMDLRCPGKEYEDYYRRVRQFGIKFIRGRPTEVYSNGKNLMVEGENSLTSELTRTEADLVVLSTAVVPSKTTNMLANILQLDLGPEGFFKEFHSRLNPVETKVPGIYLAGVAQGPKSIAEAVYQAKGAASSAVSPMIAGVYVIEVISAQVDKELCSGCGQCISICPYGAIVEKGGKAEVEDIHCRGCGLCFSVCPTQAITVRYYRPQQFEAYIDSLLEVEAGAEKEAFPRIVAFLCWK
jgi:heterodisulfide reductase subunit A